VVPIYLLRASRVPIRKKAETELPKGTNGIVSALATYLTCIFQSFEGLSQVILGRTRIY
jgi:hypothetical protein